jgi:quercetin dioxygenase-like cupin family protein
MIPKSKAPEHFHTCEETICILSGHGRMWAGESVTEVRPGSMIFLPRELPHRLECKDVSGMMLIGSFYPAGSPAISYNSNTDR